MTINKGAARASEPVADAWNIQDADFPEAASVRDQLHFLLTYATLAPSTHNTQPWLFAVEGEAVEVHADRTRRLPIADPEDRELTISCGAALLNLRLALRHFGYTNLVETFPNPGNPDLLARLHVEPRGAADTRERLLFEAIPRRHTNRQHFEDRAVPPALLTELRAEAAGQGAWLHVVEGESARSAVADLIAGGEMVLWEDQRYRHELAAWLQPNRSHQRDGIPGYAEGMGDLASLLEPLVVRTFDTGRGVAAKDSEVAAGSPVLAVLGTDADSPADWLAAGQALERVLLRARAAGVWASFLNQPIEVSELRPRLSETIGRTGFPQLLLRLGYRPDVKPTPRRLVRDVLVT